MKYDGWVNIDARINKDGISKDIAIIKKSLLALSAGATLAVGQIVKWGASFEYSMSKVAATMGGLDKAGEVFKSLERAARENAKTSIYTANEAAQALNFLAQAGYNAQKAIATLPTVLNYATAGDLGLAEATDQLVQSMSALGIETENTEYFTDMLIKTAQAAQTDARLLGSAIVAIGGTGRIVGSVEELNAALAILSNNGIQGESAGMALRNMLNSLSSPIAAGTQALNTLGVQVYDSEGRFRGLNQTFMDLKEALSGLSTEAQQKVLSDIFNVRDIRSATALLSSAGDEYKDLMAIIKGSSGTTAQTAKQMADNVRGAWKNLDSALEETAQSIWAKSAPTIQKALEKATDSINKFSDSAKGDKLADAMGQMAETLSDIAVNTLPVLVDLFSGLATVIEFVADNFRILTTTILAWKVGTIISARLASVAVVGMAATFKSAMMVVKTALISTGIGLLVIGITELIASMMGLKKSSIEVTDEGIDKVNKAMGKESNVNKFAEDIGAATKKVEELELELNKLETARALGNSTDIGREQKISDIQKEIEAEKAHIASMKAEQSQSSQLSGSQTGASIDKFLYRKPDFNETAFSWADAGNEFLTATDGVMGFANALLGVKENAGEVKIAMAELAGGTLQQLTQGLGNSAEELGRVLGEGGNLSQAVDAFGRMMVESALQAYSSVADTLIAWGTLAMINPTGAAALGYSPSMLPMGLAMKITAGAMKGMLKYADGGVVPGNSKYGDKIMARLNSGEVVLNEKQQKSAWGMMNNSGTNVNVQVINNTDSQITTSNDNQGNIKIIVEPIIAEFMTNNKGQGILKNFYGVKKVGA